MIGTVFSLGKTFNLQLGLLSKKCKAEDLSAKALNGFSSNSSNTIYLSFFISQNTIISNF